jgi:hypothetical protein
LEAVFDAFKRTREHIDRQQTKASYRFVSTRLEKAQEIFRMWLDVYELYANGYKADIATWSKPFIVKSLSLCGRGLEKKLPSIFEPRIPSEVYILLNDLFDELGCGSNCYIVAEEDGFEQRSFYDEIYKQSLKNLRPPRTVSVEQDLRLMNAIQEKDLPILYYERGQHDNALCWPLLLHEALHWLYIGEGLDKLETKIEKKPPWLNEVLIDIYVSHLFGPAYAMSLVSYLSRYPHEETLSHPHYAVRLYACFRYLIELVESKKLPSPLNEEVYGAMKYVEEFQRLSEELEEIQEQLNEIYEKTCAPILGIISGKTKPFASRIEDLQNKKKEATRLSPKEYPLKEIFLTTDVQNYYDWGVPIAAEPKVLFNSFISKKYVDRGIDALFVRESLKRYHVRRRWLVIGQK